MNYCNKFPELYILFAGYFNQDWTHLYQFKGGKSDVLEVARFYKTEDSAEGIAETIAQLEELLSLNLTEEELDQALDQLGTDYYALADNWTNREWLNKTLEILKNPNEISKIVGRVDYGHESPTEEMLAILQED